MNPRPHNWKKPSEPAPHNVTRYWSNTGQILIKYWSNVGQLGLQSHQILVKFWSNTDQILIKYWSTVGKTGIERYQILVKFWSNTGQILIKYWSNTTLSIKGFCQKRNPARNEAETGLPALFPKISMLVSRSSKSNRNFVDFEKISSKLVPNIWFSVGGFKSKHLFSFFAGFTRF